MTNRFNPARSGFDARVASTTSHRSSQGYHRFGTVINEQLTALGAITSVRIMCPTAVFADFRER